MAVDRRRMRKVSAEDADPKKRAVFKKTHPHAFFKSDGSLSFYCAGCEATLLHKINYGQVQGGGVYQCNKCETYNEIPPAHFTN